MSSLSSPSLPFDVTKYDILLRKHENNHVEIMSFGDHVGNRRFQILLEIHRKAYNVAVGKQDSVECESILDDIVRTICHKCVPNGRFLEQDLSSTKAKTEPKWNNLGDGPLARERIRRGFLGLLFTLPIEKRNILPPVSLLPEKKKVNVNLADERFVIEGIPPRKTSELARLRSRSRLEERTSSSPPLHIIQSTRLENIESTSSRNSKKIPKSQVLQTDVLFFGKNADAIFHINHVANVRLNHLLGMKSRYRSSTVDTNDLPYIYARELVQDTIEAYPHTRFLRVSDNDFWIQMDTEDAISRIAFAISQASKYVNKRHYSDITSSETYQKLTNDVSTFSFSSSSSSSNDSSVKLKRSRAA